MDAYLKGIIRDVPDFPKPGIVFEDITPILTNPEAFKRVIDTFAGRYSGMKIDAFAAIESRGFVFGAPLAYLLGKGCVLIRKKGKLPYKTVEMSYDLEYGSATIEMHIDAVKPGDNIVVIDDLLATGGTVQATCELVKKQGANVVECAFVVELGYLNGRKRIKDSICSLVRYD